MSAVEIEQGMIAERLANLARRVDDIAPMVREVTILNEQVSGVVEDIGSLRTQVGAVGAMLEKRDQTASAERAGVKIALIGLTGTILASVLGGVAALILG